MLIRFNQVYKKISNGKLRYDVIMTYQQRAVPTTLPSPSNKTISQMTTPVINRSRMTIDSDTPRVKTTQN